jgi:protein HIRA/HIR1
MDAHPTLKLFATASGGNSVKIWSLQPAEDEGVATFELLATLADHQQAVNCVRWAGHGRYLASGSDDQLVLLYELQAGAPAPVPSGPMPGLISRTGCAAPRSRGTRWVGRGFAASTEG